MNVIKLMFGLLEPRGTQKSKLQRNFSHDREFGRIGIGTTYDYWIPTITQAAS